MGFTGNDGDKAVSQAPQVHEVSALVRAEAVPGNATPGAGHADVKAASAKCEQAGTLPVCSIDFGDHKAGSEAATANGKAAAAGSDSAAAAQTPGKDGASKDSADTKLSEIDKHLVDMAAGYVKASATETNPALSAREFGEALRAIEFRSGNQAGIDPKFGARAAAVTDQLRTMGVSNDVINHWQSTTNMLSPKQSESQATISAAADAATPAAPVEKAAAAPGDKTAVDRAVANHTDAKMTGEDQHLADLAAGFVKASTLAKTPADRAQALSAAYDELRFVPGNGAGISPQFGNRADAATSQLQKMGVSQDVIDCWVNTTNMLKPKNSSQ